MNRRVLEAVLGVLGLCLLFAATYAFFRDVARTIFRPREEPAAEKLARAELETVQNPANGWFPYPRQPLFSWEQDEEGWRLESDAPLALAPLAPEVTVEADGEAPEAARAAADDSEGSEKLSLVLSAERASDGARSLAVPVRFPDPATIFCRAGALQGVRFIAYDVFIPATVQGYAGCLFFLKDKDGRWFQARARTPLHPGAWTTVTADLRGGSPDVEPLGHLGQWDENQASQVQTVGLTFYGDRPYNGNVWVDNFRGWIRGERLQQLLAKPAGAKDLTPERRAELAQLLPAAAGYQEAPLAFLNLRTQPAAGLEPGGDSAPAPPVVSVYHPFTVSFEVNRQIANPFEPAQADIRAKVWTPSGAEFEVCGFWSQDFEEHDRFAAEQLTPVGRPGWRVRVTPREPGEHRLQITASLNGGQVHATGPVLRFRATPSGDRGFVRISRADPYFFEYENGEFLYLVGHNTHSPVDLRCWTRIFGRQPPPERGLNMYEDFFPKMSAAGENVGEVWMASWWLGLEWTRRWPNYHGPGRYSLERAWKLDRLLDLARANGLLVHLVIDNHGKFSDWCDYEWNDNPYNRAGDPGGWLSSVRTFFTDARARQLHQQRLRYILARWAGDPAILGWEVVSEFDLIGDSPRDDEGRFHTSPEARQWVREMADTIRREDPYHHPITNHYSGDYHKVDRALADSPALDYVVGDGYREMPGYYQMALNAGEYYAQFHPKPFWITEYGGNWNATSEARLKADLHSGLWSTWMTPAAGTPLFWWYDYVDVRDLYSHYHAFSQYIRGEDRRGQNGHTGPTDLTGQDEGLAAISYRWARGAYVWVYDAQAMAEMPEPGARVHHEGAVARVTGLSAGRYQIEYWNTYTGQVVGGEKTADIQQSYPLDLQLPPFDNDIAAKVKWIGALPPRTEGYGEPPRSAPPASERSPVGTPMSPPAP